MKNIVRLFLMLAATTLSYGQAVSTNGGSIQGTVTDSSNAAIPGASITITSPATGYSHSLTSDSAGYYSLGPLNPGTYIIDVTAGGFGHLKLTSVVQTGTVTSGNAKLNIGSADTVVEVTTGVIQINTDQMGVSGIVTREQIDTLPVNGRNILDVAQIQPGVILQSGESFDPTKAGYSALSVSGVGGRTTRILLDGQDITDETVGTTLFNVPSGAIDEFQLNRANQDVSGEETSTGDVLVATRSGTNRIHGNAFYNFQDYRTGFANVNGLQAPFQRNQFGGYIGGPIIKDKLFFFGGGERLKQSESDAAQSPNALFNDITGQAPPTTPTQKQYPFVPAPFRDTFSMARLDYNGPHGIHFFVRGAYSVNADAATFGFAPYAIYLNRDNVPALVGGADFTTGNFTHSFRVGYEKFHNLIGDETQSLGGSIYNPSTSAANQISLNGDFYAGPNFLAPQQTYQSDKQFRYDGTWTHGAHNVKFGYSENRLLNGGFAEFYGTALYTQLAAVATAYAPCTLPTNVANAPANTCPDNPVYGYQAQYYIIGNGNSLFSERPGFGLSGGGDPSWRFGAYVADSWKVKPWLTVNAGLRWSVDTDRANQDLPTPLCSSVDPGLQFPGCTGNTPLFDQYQLGLGKRTHQPYANFAPQLGFVASPGNHKTSYRGGAGVFYESNIFNNTGNARSELIQAPGAYFNYGYLPNGAGSVFLPGIGGVAYFNSTTGAPCKGAAAGCVSVQTVSQESIAQAAPQLNLLKSYYQSQVQGSVSSNPSYIGSGDGLFANNLYAGPYVAPYSVQFNGGVQRELAKGLIVSADYIHNETLKVPLSVDVNHDGAARTLNVAAAQNAVASTVTACNVATLAAALVACPGLETNPITGVVSGAQLSDFSANGLDSGSVVFGGASASAYGATPSTGAAFPGSNPNVGEGLFILPVGRSQYDALQVVVQQQKAHPLPGLVSSNLQVSYTLSRILSSAAGVSDQFFGGGRPFNNDNPNQYIGRNNIDHTNELSFGGSVGIKYGLMLGFIGHFYSAPPASLTLDNLSGNTGQIFISDVNGDGLGGDLAPGTNAGDFMHKIKGTAALNKLISNYNATNAGNPTPAGTALINSGVLTLAQLTTLGAVQQPIAPASPNSLPNAAFRDFGFNGSYPIKLGKFREGMTLTPAVAMYNAFNMSNFGRLNGTLLNAGDAGTPDYVNGPSDQNTLNALRVQRGSGTFDAGGPRTTEFQLRLTF